MAEHQGMLIKETDPLDLLEAKVRAIETKLFGADGPPEKLEQPVNHDADVVDSLLKSQTIMNTAITSQEKIGKLVKRMNELDEVLDPSYENVAVHDASKIELLLLMYDDLSDVSGQLKILKESADVLNSEQIRSVPKMEDRLNRLVKTVEEDKSKVYESNRNVRNMLTNYNRLITTFTKTFAHLNEIVTALEVASEIKKDID